MSSTEVLESHGTMDLLCDLRSELDDSDIIRLLAVSIRNQSEEPEYAADQREDMLRRAVVIEALANAVEALE